MGDRGKHGPPITLRCVRCKRGRYHPTRIETTSAEGLSATGRTRVLPTYHGKHHVTLYEVRHAACGHVMWSNHRDARRLFERTWAAVDQPRERATEGN